MQKKAVPQAPARPDPAGASDSQASAEAPGADSDSDEESYERRPRVVVQPPAEQKRAAALPTKSLDGELVRGEVETAPRAADRLWVPGVTIEDDLADEADVADQADEDEERGKEPAAKIPSKRGTGKDKGQKREKPVAGEELVQAGM